MTIPALRSDQDHAAFLARGWAVLRDLSQSRTRQTYYADQFALHLHEAMGYRAEHLDELAF